MMKDRVTAHDAGDHFSLDHSELRTGSFDTQYTGFSERLSTSLPTVRLNERRF
jgi:hypothetical protein